MATPWESEGSSAGGMSLNVTWVSLPSSLTHTFSQSLPPSLSLIVSRILTCLILSPSLSHQGFEKGWRDYRWTAEEDREQPQSP